MASSIGRWIGNWVGKWLGNLGGAPVPPVPRFFLNLSGELAHIVLVSGSVMEGAQMSGAFTMAISCEGGRAHDIQKGGVFAHTVDLGRS